MNKDTLWFIAQQLATTVVVYISQYIAGTLVLRKNLRVNYSRKIIHFSGFFAPVLVTAVLPVRPTYNLTNFLWGSVVGFCSMAVYSRPIRERSQIVMRMFRGMDRPEDRPYTLPWLYTQMFAGYVILVPFVIYFEREGLIILALIPILINAIGDGLAEPVGVRWGKHKYRVRALFTKATYTRSLEGSACVFIAAVLVMLAFHQSFTSTELLVLMLVVPISATLAEAWSPHTWDTPFIFLAVSAPIVLVKMF